MFVKSVIKYIKLIVNYIISRPIKLTRLSSGKSWGSERLLRLHKFINLYNNNCTRFAIF